VGQIDQTSVGRTLLSAAFDLDCDLDFVLQYPPGWPETATAELKSNCNGGGH